MEIHTCTGRIDVHRESEDRADGDQEDANT
jgi:hypothetical protein